MGQRLKLWPPSWVSVNVPFSAVLLENNLSYSAFVDGLRHELAIEHLQKNEMSLGEIGFALGYASQSAFQTAFKRWTGIPPSQYGKQIRAARSLGRG